jgi:lipoprotein-releasing system ATP-binding protein
VLVPTLAGKGRDSIKDVEARAVDLLQRVGLKEWLLHRPGELSVGQRQRVAVVRALINKPRLLLADEPTGSLDEETSQNIAELLVELNRSEEVTLIVVTHSTKLAEYMGQVLELSDGVLKNRQA